MMYLVDTDILIDALRGYKPAQHFVRENREEIALSVLTVAALYAGVRNRGEERVLNEFHLLFSKVDVGESIARKAGFYRYRYGKSHGTGLVDALLAATAEAKNLVLATLNRKHYPMLQKLHVPYSKD